MDRADILQQLKDYVVRYLLDGKDVDLSETTPLLEWGILKSFETLRLVGFLQKHFQISISSENLLSAENFANLAAITNLVMESTAAKPVEL